MTDASLAAAKLPPKPGVLDRLPLLRDFGRFIVWIGRVFFRGKRAFVSVLAIAIFAAAMTAGYMLAPERWMLVTIVGGAVALVAFTLVALMFVRSRLRSVEERRAEGVRILQRSISQGDSNAQKLTYKISGELHDRVNDLTRRLDQLIPEIATIKETAGRDTAQRLDRLEGDVWLAIERVQEESEALLKDTAGATQQKLDALFDRSQRAETDGQTRTAALLERVHRLEAQSEALKQDLASRGDVSEAALAAATSKTDDLVARLAETEDRLQREIAASFDAEGPVLQVARDAVAPILQRIEALQPQLNDHAARLDGYDVRIAAQDGRLVTHETAASAAGEKIEAVQADLAQTSRRLTDVVTASKTLQSQFADAKERVINAVSEATALRAEFSRNSGWMTERVDRAERQVMLQTEARIATAAELALLRGSVEQIVLQSNQAREEVDRLRRDDITRLHSEFAAIGERSTTAREIAERTSDAVWQKMGEIQAEVSTTLRSTTEGAAQKIAELSEELELSMRRVAAMAAQAATLQTETKSLADRLASLDDEAKRRSDTTSREVERLAANLEQSTRVIQRFGGANAGIAQPYMRYLSEDKLQRLEKHWSRVFGLSMSRAALASMAHQVCQAEESCVGGFPGPIETLMVRLLAARSLPPGGIEILEIGSLYGVGAGLMHRFPGAGHDSVGLTIIDPLDRSYSDAPDLAGVSVSSGTLERNMAALGVPGSDFRLIQRRSTEHEALIEARDRRYDVIIIDGDHSVPGVAFDFEAYAPMLKPGGILIFDDYGSEQWPGVQPFVDDYVRTRPEWVWVGAEYRLGVMRRRIAGEEAPAEIPATNVSPLFAERR